MILNHMTKNNTGQVLPVTREMLGRGHTVTTVIFKAEHRFTFPNLGMNHTLLELAPNNSKRVLAIRSILMFM